MNLRNVTFVTLLLAVVAGTAVAQSGYAITASDTTPVPEKTVEFQGNTHTIDETVRVSPGDTFTAEVDAPDEVYRLYLYDSDRTIVDERRGDGPQEFEFDTSEYEIGTYALAASSDAEYQAVHPVVVSGYDVSVDAPASVNETATFDVTVDVTQTAADSEPEQVQVVFDADGNTSRFDAEGGDGEYTATVDAGELDAGDYDVYGIAQSDEQAFGENEIVGLSDPGSLSVEEATVSDNGTDDGGDDGDSDDSDNNDSSDDSSDNDSDDSDDSSDDSDTGADDETETATPDENETVAADETPENETDTPGEDTDTPDETQTTHADTATPDEETDTPGETETAGGAATTEGAGADAGTETDDAMLTPGGNETGTAADGPGFTAAGALVAVLALVALQRRA